MTSIEIRSIGYIYIPFVGTYFGTGIEDPCIPPLPETYVVVFPGSIYKLFEQEGHGHDNDMNTRPIHISGTPSCII